MFCHDNYITVKDAKKIWYLIFEIPNTIPQKVFGKVFKYPQINMYLVFYLNTSFSVFDPTLHSTMTTTNAHEPRLTVYAL